MIAVMTTNGIGKSRKSNIEVHLPKSMWAPDPLLPGSSKLQLGRGFGHWLGLIHDVGVGFFIE